MQESKCLKAVTIFLIIVAACAISLPGAFSSGPLYPDGQRYLFNGILLHDLIRDGKLFDPYHYSIKFYAQYPATNLPYGPPFFALIFAIVFSLLGISVAVARLVIAICTAGAALMCWYLIYKLEKNFWVAILAVSVFLLNPLTGIFARDVAVELPAIFFSFLTIYAVYRYVEYDRKYFCLFAAIAFSLGYLTKQYIIPLGLALPVYVLIRKKWRLLWKGETLLSVLIVVLLILPYTLIVFKFTTEDLGIKTFPPIDLELILVYPKMMLYYAPITSILAIGGFILGIRSKNRLTLLFLMWTISWYLFFTFYYGHYREERYFLLILPALAYPFGIAFYSLAGKLRKWRMHYVLSGLLAVYSVYEAGYYPIFYVNGHEDAGKYVADNPYGKTVLFYGTYDGTFMLGIRRHISQGGPYVLRGERQLAIRVWEGGLKDKDSVKSPDEIIKLLRKYQTGYVVVERDMSETSHYEEYINLLKALDNELYFQPVTKFPIRTNYRKYYKNLGSELVVYKVNFIDKTDRTIILKIPVPTLEQGLEVEL